MEAMLNPPLNEPVTTNGMQETFGHQFLDEPSVKWWNKPRRRHKADINELVELYNHSASSLSKSVKSELQAFELIYAANHESLKTRMPCMFDMLVTAFELAKEDTAKVRVVLSELRSLIVSEMNRYESGSHGRHSPIQVKTKLDKVLSEHRKIQQELTNAFALLSKETGLRAPLIHDMS